MLESVSTGKGDSDSRTVMLQCETPDIVRFDSQFIVASTELNLEPMINHEIGLRLNTFAAIMMPRTMASVIFTAWSPALMASGNCSDAM